MLRTSPGNVLHFGSVSWARGESAFKNTATCPAQCLWLHPHIELEPSTPSSKRLPWGPTETPAREKEKPSDASEEGDQAGRTTDAGGRGANWLKREEKIKPTCVHGEESATLKEEMGNVKGQAGRGGSAQFSRVDSKAVICILQCTSEPSGRLVKTGCRLQPLYFSLGGLRQSPSNF